MSGRSTSLPGFGKAVRLEYAKMRRLRTSLVLGAVLLATILFGTMQLFDADHRARINEPNTMHWEFLLLTGYSSTKALFMPLLAAVLASRQVDIEHHGNGWLRASMFGVTPGRLCTVKLLALTPLVALSTVVEMSVLVLASRATGATTPLPWVQWLWYGAVVVVVTLGVVGLHLWLAARVESQLVGLGVGVLGGFLGFFSMLMPPWFAHLTPWGYLAAGLPYQLSPTGDAPLIAIPLPWGSMALFCCVMLGVLALARVRLDRVEI